MWWLDRLAADILAPLAVWVFASSLDDFLLDVSFVVLWLRSRRERDTSAAPSGVGASTASRQAKIGIMIPCWDEEAVIEQMLEHNLTAIDYENYDVWLGVYPNDDATLAKVSACEASFGRVHYVVCPHDGPTTKADCLNWIYDGITHAEQRRGETYDVLLQHDAEDLIHRDALKRIHENIGRFDMIQIPVFPLATPLRNATHGTYCDFFAEFHMKELRQRAEFGGFVPSAGVGTAYRRKALEALRLAKKGRVFDEECLTEDYAVGFDLYRLGCSQTLLHADAAPWPRIGAERAAGRHQPRGLPVATRAYFPRRLREAARQRTRWVLGIALQSWGNFGWRADGRQLYWLWRDRKGLVGHPASMLANLIFCYGLVSWIGSIEDGSVWRFGGLLASDSWLLPLLVINSVLIVWRQLVRGYFSHRVYGWRQALSVPLRAPWANVINCCATLHALWIFAWARWRGQSLRWAKTTHSYPSRQSLAGERPRLGELLVVMGKVDIGIVESALQSDRQGQRLGEYLIGQGSLAEIDLDRALRRQQGNPGGRLGGMTHPAQTLPIGSSP